MNPWLDALLVVLAAVGHVALWTWIWDAVHARHQSRSVRRRVSLVIILLFAVLPFAAAAALGGFTFARLAASDTTPLEYAAGGYLAVCWLAVLVRVLPGTIRRVVNLRSPALLANHTEPLANVEKAVGKRLVFGQPWKSLARIPGNQICRLAVNEKQLRCTRLPAALDGFTIAHFSDLHLTGHIGREYFEYAVEIVNRWQVDMVAVTGDLMDKQSQAAIVVSALSKLRAKHGVYFVLGNHDLRIDHARLVADLVAGGLTYLGRQPMRLPIGGAPNGTSILLAGNELPWFSGLDRETESLRESPAEDEFRILLSHSPDQIHWARERHFDLMLAGHTHGGQICLPIVGPILSCSRYGMRYIAGVYHVPPTVLHTSRGISGAETVRFNCPPELTRIVLARNE